MSPARVSTRGAGPTQFGGVKWAFNTGGPIVTSPAIANGKVFFGAGDGNIYAVDAKSGILQWKFATGDVVHASPAVAGGTVFVGSWDGVLYALDAESGVQKWAFQAGLDPVAHNQVGFQSTPAVVDGTVYVGCRDAHVYALDAKTGRMRWNFDAKSCIFSSAALAGDLACFGSHNGRLYAVNTKTGTLAWQFQTEASKQDPMKLLNPDGSLNQDAFARVFGDFQDMYIDYYRYTSIGTIMSSPAIDQGVLYIGSMDGNLYALN